jgi:Family of unknown function (DUF5522)
MKQKQQANEEYYFENGLLVFTATYLKKRGYCCGNACRNCPYEYEQVQEPKRSILLAKQFDDGTKK